MDRPSTGIDALDELLGGLGVGDNVVWQAPTRPTSNPSWRRSWPPPTATSP